MILHHLGRGADAARPISDIAEATGLPRRTVEKALEEAACNGAPIVAGPRGVYLATSAQECRAYADSLRGRIGAIAARVAALERAADGMESVQQETLWAGTGAVTAAWEAWRNELRIDRPMTNRGGDQLVIGEDAA